jgi:hypothetical protein
VNAALRTAARAAHATLAVLSAAWALLAYVPFTYQAVVKFSMVSWLPAFLGLQPALWLGALAAGAVADRGRLRARRRGHLAFYATHAVLAVALVVRPVLTRLENDRWSLVAAVAFLASALWGLVLDRPPAAAEGPARSPRRGPAALAAAAGCAALFTGLAVLRARGGAEPVGAAFALRAAGWSLSAHLLVAGGVALALEALDAVVRLARRAWLGPLLAGGAAWVAAALLLDAVVFRAIAFGGPEAALVAALAAGVLVLGAGRPLAAIVDAAAGRGPLAVLTLAAAGGAVAAAVLSGAVRFDWNFLFQKLTVAGAWALAMALALAAASRRAPRRGDAALLFVAPVVALAAFEASTALAASATPPAPGAGRAAPLDRLVAVDPSARLLRELLVPSSGETSIHGWLQANANLPPGLATAPVRVAHADPLEPAAGERPDIFVLVVDSLRRDQLGVYAPSIRHTPSIDRFARDAVVMRNAFTRYGATGLSEPSIWVGGMTLHQQYPAPFERLNALQRMLERDGYELLVSMDSVMNAVVTPGPQVRDLDPGVATQDLRLGATLERLAAELARRPAGAPPLFVYTQAQDLHVSVIHREGAQPVRPGDYGRAYAPYASRVARLDEAVGAFLDRLRASGRLERSVVILTADHGDSLGEEGRFGHAYTLFPEIVRVPLLIHLPPSLRRQLRWDADAPAFLTDLTPTLHALLGHRPVRPHPVMGRPLFRREGDPAPAAPDHFLLASSYGAVFGLVSGDGRRLYVADAINFEDHLFSLDGGPGGTRLRLTPDEKRRHDRILIEKLRELNVFYRFDPGPPPGGLE